MVCLIAESWNLLISELRNLGNRTPIMPPSAVKSVVLLYQRCTELSC